MGVILGVEESTEDSSMPDITPSVQGWECWAPKRKRLTHFYRISEYRRVAPAHPLHDFNEIFNDREKLRVGLRVKIGGDLQLRRF